MAGSAFAAALCSGRIPHLFAMLMCAPSCLSLALNAAVRGKAGRLEPWMANHPLDQKLHDSITGVAARSDEWSVAQIVRHRCVRLRSKQQAHQLRTKEPVRAVDENGANEALLLPELRSEAQTPAQSPTAHESF